MHVFVYIPEVRVMKVACLLQRACNLIQFVNLVLFGHCNVGIRPPPSSEQVESEWICSVVPPVACEVWTGAALPLPSSPISVSEVSSSDLHSPSISVANDACVRLKLCTRRRVEYSSDGVH